MKTCDNELDDELKEFQLFPDSIPQETVTSLLASGHPSIESPADAVKFLFHRYQHPLWYIIKQKILHYDLTQEELDVTTTFGRFSQRPSDLFLKVNRIHIQTKNIF